MKATKASIDSFLSNRRIAVAGVSRNEKKFGFQVFTILRERGFEVFPVNPAADEIAGVPCFRSVSALPLNVHALLVLTPKKQTKEVLAEALAKGIDNIWIQQMSDTPEALELARSRPLTLVTGECIFMHAQPVTGIHKFHRAIRKFFGTFPR